MFRFKKNIRLFGLTGQSGAGKTSAAKVFSEKGFAIIDCDKLTREVYKSGSDCNKAIAEAFGEEILLENGEIDRKKLGGIVFSDEKLLEILNTTVYPFITAAIEEKIKEITNSLIMLDAPTLFESGTYEYCERITAVVADREIRKARIMARDNADEISVERRFDSQKTEEFFRNNCEYIIENNTDETELIKQTERIADLIINEFAKRGVQNA
ncbi:MAG: dephospho-CoA kinase [Ruminococcus sp.]|jgi:dephospho-CoA kinase|nr:dephospho-CoA kinase [Ruminococcus sp.]